MRNPRSSAQMMAFIILLFAAVVLNSFQLANGAEIQKQTASKTSGKRLVVMLDNLDELLFAGNFDIAHSTYSVLRAKQVVNAAWIDTWIPSLNLIATGVISPPNLLLSTVSCLVPFLFPSKHYELAAARSTFSAEIAGYEAAKLNAYGIAYSILTLAHSQFDLMKLSEAEVALMQEYVLLLKSQLDVGIITEADYLKGLLELGRLESELEGIRSRIKESWATLRKMFAFEIDRPFGIAIPYESPSKYETLKATKTLLKTALSRSLESKQLALMAEAAASKVGSASWAWLSGCTGSTMNFGASNSNLVPNSTSVFLNLSFGIFPAIEISKLNRDEALLKSREIGFEIARVLDSTLANIDSAKKEISRLGLQLQIAKNLEKINSYYSKSEPATSVATVKEKLDSMATRASIEKRLIVAKAALSGHRITLKRMFLEGVFLDRFIEFRQKPVTERN